MKQLLPATRPDVGLLILRVALAVVVLFHGVFKVAHGVEWIKGPLAHAGLPGFLAYGAYFAEIVAPILLLFGAWTRVAALVVVFDMASAMGLVLRDQLFQVKASGGGWGVEIEAMILLTALALACTGGGRYSAVRD